MQVRSEERMMEAELKSTLTQLNPENLRMFLLVMRALADGDEAVAAAVEKKDLAALRVLVLGEGEPT